ncbi:MAG: efflux RND transporter permease subunit [Bryobacterales bacterium]|nr:efflux RND transporter permease subunit [Bryobacterales bacterium]
MLNRIIHFHLDNRWLVVMGLLLLVAVGYFAVTRIPLEAFPDLTPNQVTIVTPAPAMAPDEVADLVTFPIESAVMGLPRAQGVRRLQARPLHGHHRL